MNERVYLSFEQKLQVLTWIKDHQDKLPDMTPAEASTALKSEVHLSAAPAVMKRIAKAAGVPFPVKSRAVANPKLADEVKSLQEELAMHRKVLAILLDALTQPNTSLGVAKAKALYGEVKKMMLDAALTDDAAKGEEKSA